jgi:NAD(P)-dependent dehydrogenase (short-subunit alcohol dehydrogenase family)
MRLKDKVAIITGAARGIGAACAERFARDGAQVVIADIDTEAGEATAKAIRDAGAEATFVACDVGERAGVEALVTGTVANHGRLDCAVNCAGVFQEKAFLAIEDADFEEVLRTNLKGTFLVGQAAAREMVGRGTGGAVVNVSSTGSILASPLGASYGVSKGGVNQLTRVMAVALSDAGIRVNAVAPGIVDTRMGAQVMKDEAGLRLALSRTPMGRIGSPADIAAVAAFLASDDAAYITGQVIYADGGRLALNYTVPVKD